MNEAVRLVIVDAKQCPSEHDGAGNVAFATLESVADGRHGQERFGNDDEHANGDAWFRVVGRAVSESREGRDEDGDDGPRVPEREWQVDEDGVGEAARFVVSTERVVDRRDGRSDKQAKDERDDVVARDKDMDVDGIQHSDESEPPTDALNDVVRLIKELEHDETKQEQVDNAPRPEHVVLASPSQLYESKNHEAKTNFWSKVSLFAAVVAMRGH